MAQMAREAAKQKMVAAARAIAQIVADELGITAGIDCFTSGNIGACAETAVTLLSTFVGGLPAR